MRDRAIACVTAAVVIGLIPAAGHAALGEYVQDFESLVQSDPAALDNDGWLVYGNVFSPDGSVYYYGYGPYPAPNHNLAFSQIVAGEGGPDQGAQQLVVFSDYNNTDHANGFLIESNVFQERVVGAENVGEIWRFQFEAKLGNLLPPSTALAFIKTLDPANGYALTNFLSVDTSSIPTTWGFYSLTIPIDAGLVGQVFQFGFANTATAYQSSAVFYDNLVFYLAGHVGVPEGPALAGATLRQNVPNPFNPATRIEFSLEQPGRIELAVFDLAGRRIATLREGTLAAGDHQAVWNGLSAGGQPVPSGQYRYTLTTATGALSRSMILLK
ncbi:MAG TPA: FlgD immunoglobulin-like domain containing protein [Candidatus Krumholzibacteria bacterium]|nr:FlgD immunoglobulin-like domain containing protein [Candidatus Krumholzibacteria bacterium]HPD70212.1 FlgD immunoglobulin-like domain containing protein [Candidatus Krumholzibacteria bacterium]HRY40088.1 FlgD immunoglobulin-like domain containing protein [Candidatus Krumholzibacteria bacterium]